MLDAAPATTNENDGLMAYHGDGLVDIFLGLILLDASAVLAGGTGAFLSLAVLFPLFLVAKRGLTAPRLEADEIAGAADPRRIRLTRRVAAAGLALTLAVLGLLATRSLPPPFSELLERNLWQGLSLGGVGLIALAGYRLGAPRLLVYSGLIGATLVAAFWLRVPWVDYVFAALAASIAANGAVLLARFLGRSRLSGGRA